MVLGGVRQADKQVGVEVEGIVGVIQEASVAGHCALPGQNCTRLGKVQDGIWERKVESDRYSQELFYGG